MVKRVLVAVIFTPVIFWVLYMAPAVAVPIALSLISALGVYEGLCATHILSHSRLAAYSMLLSALIPLWVYFEGGFVSALAGLYIYVFLLFCEAIISKNTLGLERLGSALFLTLLIPLTLSFFIRVRQWELWRFYILMPFVAAFLSDAVALFAGMAFGKHKLAPELSPKKTVEGAVGGFLGATAAMMVYGLIWQRFFQLEGLSYPTLAVYGALGSIVSQVGDLSFSCIKREYGIKDFGKILPGHGGVLDRFDSVILCAPLMELLLWLLPAVR